MNALKYVFKVKSSRLKRLKWNLNLTIEEAIENKELISLADSNILRFIGEINNTVYDMDKVNNIQSMIRNLNKQKTSLENKRMIKKLYAKQYELLFEKNYICIVMENNQEYDRLNSKKGFYVNGIKFKRLLATPGGAKKSTVIYVNADIYDELHERIENGRDKTKPLVPAKLEAYKALSCSSSIPMSNPNGVLVVKDCETIFKANVIKIDDSNSEYPVMTHEKDYEVKQVDSDGYGLICPELSEKWTKELEKDSNYISTGFCIRNSFCKGMLFTFDFKDFSKNVAKENMVKDAWGNMIDITKVEIVLTTSMLKLWDSYKNINHYLEQCKNNGYNFNVVKHIPEKLENERNLNYQFIQSLELSDDDIEKLIHPTVDKINNITKCDFRYTLLYLKGAYSDKISYEKCENIFVKALMVEKEMINDPFIKRGIHNMIKKRINDAKVGVLQVNGNFSIVSGDPYSLCQSMFGLEVTGLLKSGEFYNNYWNEKNIDKVAAFRAPMTCHNNIRLLRLKNTDDMKYWYRYMKNCTIFNSWDMTRNSMNGMDFDSDIILTTNNEIIINNVKELDSIVCVQKTATKKIPTEKDLIQANKDTFGDDIGFVTNKITTMFDVRSRFDKDTDEYKELDYRICCGQHFQQNAIDKAKGIISKKMPKEWYSYKVNKIEEDDSEEIKQKKEFNIRILADKKPYFFIYIYATKMKEYKTYIKNSENNCLKRFGLTVNELRDKENKSEEEINFLKYYTRGIPVLMNNSVMNKICWKIEKEFEHLKQYKNSNFDYTILKTDSGYSKKRFSEIKNLYKDYTLKIKQYYEFNHEDSKIVRNIFKESFKIKAVELCNNLEELTNIVIDLCYTHDNSKEFAWDICGNQIIKNLLKRNNYIISYPVLDTDGDIEFDGERFKMISEKVR